MRDVYKAGPLPAQLRQPDGTLARGTAVFTLVLYERGDTIPVTSKNQPTAHPLSYWRKVQAPRGGPFRVEAPTLTGVDPVIIPEAVLNALPEDAQLRLQWNWQRKED